MFACSLALASACLVVTVVVVVGGLVLVVVLALVVGLPRVFVVGRVCVSCVIVSIPFRLAMLEIAGSLDSVMLYFVALALLPVMPVLTMLL